MSFGPAVLAFDGSPALAAGALTTNEAGQNTRRFLKDIVSVGKFKHPSTGHDFDITPDWLDNAAAQFAKMRAAGVKVPVPAGHSFKAEDNRGYVLDVYREGERLMSVIELVGDDAIAMAGRNEVSIYAAPEFADGLGNSYPWAIQHVALTPVPVIPGQDVFRAIAASRDGSSTNSVPVFRLATEGIAPMENLLKLSQAMGVDPAGKSEAELWAACMAAAGKPAEMEGQMNAIAADRDAFKAKAEELSRPPAPPSAKEIKLAREVRELKIGRLLDAAKINQAEADGLRGIWIGDDKALALSATLDTGNDERFDATIELLRKTREPARPVVKPIEASRRVNDDEPSDLHPELEAQRKARREAEAKR